MKNFWRKAGSLKPSPKPTFRCCKSSKAGGATAWTRPSRFRSRRRCARCCSTRSCAGVTSGIWTASSPWRKRKSTARTGTARFANWRGCITTASVWRATRGARATGNLVGAFRTISGRRPDRNHHHRRHARACCRCWPIIRRPSARKFSPRATITAVASGATRAASGCRNALTWTASNDFCRRRTSAGSFSTRTAILHARPRPRYGTFAPIFTPNGIAAFGRDFDSSRQVWSKHEGYPGDPRYRDFYRDVGFDLDFDYVKPHLPSPDNRGFTGIKYYRITGGTGDKEIYQRDAALQAAAEHAGHFLNERVNQVQRLAGLLDRPPLVVAPYDAELFGHWWYEGPEFLDYFARKLFYDQKTVALITPGEYLRRHPTNQIATPGASSWGEEGYWRAWLNENNEWIYPHLQVAQERMTDLAQKFPAASRVEGAGAATGRARTAAGAGQRLAVHFARGHQPRLRAPPREGPSAPLHRAARSTHRHAAWTKNGCAKSNRATTFSPTWIGIIGSDEARGRFVGKRIFR